MLREVMTIERLGAMGADEAAAFLVARRAEGMAPHEEAVLADWIAAEAAHEAAFDRANRAWDAFAGAEDSELLRAMRDHALAAPAQAPARKRFAVPRLAAAAAILLLVLASAALLMPSLYRAPQPDRVETLTFASAAGQVRTIALPDGSTMLLDADSRVTGRFGAKRRDLQLLAGRAFFAVRPDPSRPFAVTAGGEEIVAKGTKFEVDGIVANRLLVTLTEGRVSVTPVRGGEAILLQPGQRLTAIDGRRIVDTLAPSGADPAAWQKGLIDLEDRTLAEAAAEINRYAGTSRIVIRDPRVAALRVSGQFRAGDVARFTDTVAEVLPVRGVRREGEIELVMK